MAVAAAARLFCTYRAEEAVRTGSLCTNRSTKSHPTRTHARARMREHPLPHLDGPVLALPVQRVHHAARHARDVQRRVQRADDAVVAVGQAVLSGAAGGPVHSGQYSTVQYGKGAPATREVVRKGWVGVAVKSGLMGERPGKCLCQDPPPPVPGWSGKARTVWGSLFVSTSPQNACVRVGCACEVWVRRARSRWVRVRKTKGTCVASCSAPSPSP